MMWYSRRYCSFSRAFILEARPSDLLAREVARLLRLQPRRCGGAELGDQVQVRAEEGGDEAGDEQHVDRVEAAQGGGPELGAARQEVGQVGADERARGGEGHAHDPGPERAAVGAERVEPVGAVGDLAVEEPAQERPGPGALVDPAGDRDRDLAHRLLPALGIGLPLPLLEVPLVPLAAVAVQLAAVAGRRGGGLAA